MSRKDQTLPRGSPSCISGRERRSNTRPSLKVNVSKLSSVDLYSSCTLSRKRLRVVELIKHVLKKDRVVLSSHDRLWDAPHLHKSFIGVQHLAFAADRQDAVGDRFQNPLQRRFAVAQVRLRRHHAP